MREQVQPMQRRMSDKSPTDDAKDRPFNKKKNAMDEQREQVRALFGVS